MENQDFKEKYYGKGKIPEWIFLLWGMGLFLVGCTDDGIDQELLEENVQALASTRTVMAITKCVDSYIYSGLPIWKIFMLRVQI